MFAAFIFISLNNVSHACGEITPSYMITKNVKRLVYPDFPTASDVFAIMRIESSMNPNAMNHNEKESSNGLMQVQNGPMDIRRNIAMGVSLLREYYMLTGSREGAIKSYNIGPRNYLNHKLIKAGNTYYGKFLLQKVVYAHYPNGKITLLGKHLGCGRLNSIIDYRLAHKKRR